MAPLSPNLPRISLDPLADFVGVVTIKGTEYGVLQATGEVYAASSALALKARARKEGATSTSEENAADLESMYRAVAQVLPDMAADEVRKLNLDQVSTVLLIACKAADEVAKLFPKAMGGQDSTLPSSSQPTP